MSFLLLQALFIPLSTQFRFLLFCLSIDQMDLEYYRAVQDETEKIKATNALHRNAGRVVLERSDKWQI